MEELEALALLGLQDLEPTLLAAAKAGVIKLLEENKLMATGKIAYWKSKGAVLHEFKIGFWNEDLSLTNDFLNALGANTTVS